MSDTIEDAMSRVLRRANMKFDRAISELDPSIPPPPPSTRMEALGQSVRAFNDALNEMAAQFAKGYNASDRMVKR